MNFVIYTLILLILVYWVDQKGTLTPNLLILRKNPGEELESWLKDFSFKEGGRALPRYKFYSDVIEQLLSVARKIGGSYSDSFLFLREGLREDLQFEKKIKEVKTGLWLQILLMFLITWGFIFFALHITKSDVSMKGLAFILLWELVGVFLIPLCLRFFRKKYFQDIGEIWKMTFILKSLSRTPLARSEVFTLAGMNKIEEIQNKNLLPILDKLRSLCKECLKQGKSYEEDLKNIMEELRFTENWHFSLFEKRLMALKITVLGVFFLPSYLSFIFLLVGSLNL